MLSNLIWSLLAAPLARCFPHPQGGGPGVPVSPPTVNNMTMFGTGCPIGAAGISQVTAGGTPVFVFREWGLVLPNPDGEKPDTVSKWCNEEITLGNGPVGMRLRIASVTVGGWAQLDAGTKVSFEVTTRLGGIEAGKRTLFIGPEAIKDNQFQVTLETEPTDIWSACVAPSGDVPHLTVRTTVGMVGTAAADGTISKGILGGNNTDMAKALRINFRPIWDPCPTS